jgi:hypothetical protein
VNVDKLIKPFQPRTGLKVCAPDCAPTCIMIAVSSQTVSFKVASTRNAEIIMQYYISLYSQGACGYGMLDKEKYPYWSVAALSTSSEFYKKGPVQGCG